MKLIKWIKDMLDADSSISSKRFCGVLGWIIVLFVLVWCTVTVTEAPTMVETAMYVIAGLLGIDKISDIFKSKNNKRNHDNFDEQIN